MKVNLTPDEITCEIGDLKVVFHKINSMTSTELLLGRKQMLEKPLILVQKLTHYIKSIEGLFDTDGNALGVEHLSRIPSSIIHDIYNTFLGEAALAGNQLMKDPQEVEQGNSEEPVSDDSGKEQLSTPA